MAARWISEGSRLALVYTAFSSIKVHDDDVDRDFGKTYVHVRGEDGEWTEQDQLLPELGKTGPGTALELTLPSAKTPLRCRRILVTRVAVCKSFCAMRMEIATQKKEIW